MKNLILNKYSSMMAGPPGATGRHRPSTHSLTRFKGSAVRKSSVISTLAFRSRTKQTLLRNIHPHALVERVLIAIERQDLFRFLRDVSQGHFFLVTHGSDGKIRYLKDSRGSS
jgi:hypothetical protein